jgi:cryptochrome
MQHKCAIHWFRKGLRLHDNPSLLSACDQASKVIPLFILDPHFANPGTVSPRRYQFLLECLQDLDTSLREKYGTQLYVARGTPADVMSRLASQVDATLLTFESDTEPYACSRDAAVTLQMQQSGVKVEQHSSHTLHDIAHLSALCQDKPPTVYKSFLKNVFYKAGPVQQPAPLPSSINPLSSAEFTECVANVSDMKIELGVPSLEELGYPGATVCPFQGGETAGLQRMSENLARKQWIASFEKPKTSPNSLSPETTVLSPYLKFGCVSVRTFWHGLQEVYAQHKGSPRSLPPTSLDGQLLWREFYYTSAALTSNYDRMVGNPICRQIQWLNPDTSTQVEKHLTAWKEGRTGYPFIDAIMTQLRTEGWIHHLARHAVACFLTRGDLFISWEHGVRHFEWALLDADWSINVGNWMWLSASCYFYQYFRCYSPVAFGKKTDKNGDYIRKWLPQLRKYPKKYIYEPWTAPLAVQKEAGCIIGTDYPNPIVEHREVSKRNMGWMKQAYDEHKARKNGSTSSSSSSIQKKRKGSSSKVGSKNASSSKKSKEK